MDGKEPGCCLAGGEVAVPTLVQIQGIYGQIRCERAVSNNQSRWV